MNKMKCIGMPKYFYPEKRCIKTSDKYVYKDLKFLNIHSYLRRFTSNKIGEEFIFNPFFDFGVDLYHSFNHICITKKKWLVTFETTVPRFLKSIDDDENNSEHRYNKKTEKYLSKIAEDNCLAAIAISKCSYNHQLALLESYPKLKPIILDKLEVLYPPQKLIAQPKNVKEKSLECVELLFVGGDFYRKGGAELVLAFDEAMNDGLFSCLSIKLTIVGDLSKKHNYALNDYQDDDEFFNNVEKIIHNNGSIKHFDKVSNDELLRMMEVSHVGLLSTWADTFGYSVLEFQANGCPVITTDIRALPEINNEMIGWVINLKKNRLGEVIVNSLQDKEYNRSIIINRLKEIFYQINSDKEVILNKGLLCLSNITKNHNVDDYNNRIGEIYNRRSGV